MGQRANYIVKDYNRQTIYYNHWRANCITADLYLGEKRFLQFLDKCQLTDTILNEPWIEGCVIVDISKKELYFWTLHFSQETSVINCYLIALAEKWKGWNIQLLTNRMYDSERILGIDYISKQELPKLDRRSTESVTNDKVEEWVIALIVIKRDQNLFVTKTGGLNKEEIISYGQEIIRLLEDKPAYKLPKEGEEEWIDCVVIDTVQKKLLISESVFGLWEQCKGLWEGYEFMMGDYGYCKMLELVGIETSHLLLPHDKVIEDFSDLITVHNDNFDPVELAEKLVKDHKDVQFNPDFFDNVKPRKTAFETLIARIKKILRKS
jgi:hypothetical protein